MEFEVVIDRIEGDVAVLLPVGPVATGCRPGARLLWPKRLLPAGAGEGSHLTVSVALDPAATAAARKRVEGLLGDLRSPSDKRGPESVGGGR